MIFSINMFLNSFYTNIFVLKAPILRQNFPKNGAVRGNAIRHGRVLVHPPSLRLESTIASLYLALICEDSQIITKSPMQRFLDFWCHFWRRTNRGATSDVHFFQNMVVTRLTNRYLDGPGSSSAQSASSGRILEERPSKRWLGVRTV